MKKRIEGHLINLGITKEGKFLRAVRSGNFDKVRKFIDNGINPNARTKNDLTALMIAAFNGNLKIVRILLDAGADPNIEFLEGKTALLFAVRAGHVDVVKLLIKAGANPNDRYKGKEGDQTALSWALSHGVNMVKLLLSEGADPKAVFMEDQTALCWCAFKGYTDVAQELINAGADVNMKLANGFSLLDTAIVRGHKEIVKILLSTNIDPMIAAQAFTTASHHQKSDLAHLIAEYIKET